MNIGYACLTLGVPDTDQKTCIKKNADPDRLSALIAHNLSSLDRIIDYNIKQDITLFRISSDIIPFGSSPVNTLDWTRIFADQLSRIGEKARKNKMRLSMHPGQYTVLNSPNPDVVRRSIEDLDYHCRFLDALGMDKTNKLILHIGGIYDDKPAAMQRFIDNYDRLSPAVKDRLIIENDDKLYTVEDILSISEKRQIPVVYDTLHQDTHPAAADKSHYQWIADCRQTWKADDGPQKIHYSQQDPGKKPGAHAPSIRIEEFLSFYQGLDPDHDLSVMLEVKDKNLSAVKCISCTADKPSIRQLEQEWGRYKYTVLEHSHRIYLEIRELLKDKKACPAKEFYLLIEQALASVPDIGSTANACQHVWGYFKKQADAREKALFERQMNGLAAGTTAPSLIKRQLHRMAVKYQESYLLNSYFFDLQLHLRIR